MTSREGGERGRGGKEIEGGELSEMLHKEEGNEIGLIA